MSAMHVYTSTLVSFGCLHCTFHIIAK